MLKYENHIKWERVNKESRSCCYNWSIQNSCLNRSKFHIYLFALSTFPLIIWWTITLMLLNFKLVLPNTNFLSMFLFLLLDIVSTNKWSQCQICKLVITSVNLWRHMRTQHTNQEPQKCNRCNKQFKNKYSLREHVRMAHENKQQQHQQDQPQHHPLATTGGGDGGGGGAGSLSPRASGLSIGSVLEGNSSGETVDAPTASVGINVLSEAHLVAASTMKLFWF